MRPLGVQAVRQRVVDGVDLGIARSARRRRRRRARCRACAANARGARRIARGDRRRSAASGTERAGPDQRHRRDTRRAQDADAKRRCGRHGRISRIPSAAGGQPRASGCPVRRLWRGHLPRRFRHGMVWRCMKKPSATRTADVRARPRCADGCTAIPGEQPQDGTYIKLNTNENPVSAVGAGARGDRRAARTTTCASIQIRWRTRCAMRRRRRYDLTRDHIVAGNGSDELLAVVLRACTEPGDTRRLSVS